MVTGQSSSARSGQSSGGQGSSSNAQPRSRQKASSEINRSFFNLYIKVFKTKEFDDRFNIMKMKPLEVNTWIAQSGSTTTGAEEVRELYELALTRRPTKKKKSTSGGKTVTDSTVRNSPQFEALEVFRIPQIAQIFRAAAAVCIYGRKDNRVFELFTLAFNKLNWSTRYIIGTRYLPAVLDLYTVKDSLRSEAPSTFEALLFFHGCSIHRSSNNTIDFNTGTRIGYVIQKMVYAWQRLISLVQPNRLGTLKDLITPYVLFNSNTCRFDVLTSRSRGWSTSEMETSLIECTHSSAQTKVNVRAFARTIPEDSSIRQVVDLFFKTLNAILSKKYLYSGKDAEIAVWKELIRFKLPNNIDKLPRVFKELPAEVFATLGVVTNWDDVESDDDSGDQVVVDLTRPNLKRGRDEENRGSGQGEPSTVVKEEPQKTEPMLIDTPVNVAFRPLKNREMSENTRKQYEAMNFLFDKKFKFLDIPFQELEESAAEHGLMLDESIDFVLTDPPYNIRRNAEKANSYYDSMTMEDIDKLTELFKFAMKPGAHGIIFCSYQQFEVYRTSLNNHTIELKDYETDPSGNTKHYKPLFVVESTPIVLIKKDGGSIVPVRGGASHVNMTEICVHFWKRSPDGHEVRQNVDWKTLPNFPSRFPGWSNVISDVPQPVGEEVRWMEVEQETPARNSTNKSMKKSKRVRVRPEQKSIELLQFFIKKFTKPGDTVLDCCAGTASTLFACMSLQKHRKVIGTEIDSNATIAVEDDLLRCYAQQILNGKSDLTTTDPDFTKAAQTVVSHDLQRKVNQRYDAWALPSGLIPVQSFPPHVIEYICQMYDDFSLLPHRAQPMIKWSNRWLQRFNTIDVKALQTYECQQYNIRIKPSTIKHKDAGLGVFATKGFKKDDVIGYYYGTLVYGDIATDHRVRKRYGVGIMSVSSKEFSKWALQIDHTFVDSRDRQHTGYVCPGQFSTMKYINSYKYINGDKDKAAYDNKTLDNPRTANTKYVLNNRRNRNAEFETYEAISVVATEDIVANQELFLEYGDKYTFPSSTADDDPEEEEPETTEPPVKELTRAQPPGNPPQQDPNAKNIPTEPEAKTTAPGQTEPETKSTKMIDPFDF